RPTPSHVGGEGRGWPSPAPCAGGCRGGGSPSVADLLAAREPIAAYLKPTALHRYPALDELLGTQTWVKHENHQPICAFKIRGGINLMSQLSDDERRRGVITASTGNHGQSIAYAAGLFELRAMTCLPAVAIPV